MDIAKLINPIKKKRGGFRPGSGRKRIHPKKEDKPKNANTSITASSGPTTTRSRASKSKYVENQYDDYIEIKREDEGLNQIQTISMEDITDFEIQLLLGLEYFKPVIFNQRYQGSFKLFDFTY
jgi:hypothetical protein